MAGVYTRGTPFEFLGPLSSTLHDTREHQRVKGQEQREETREQQRHIYDILTRQDTLKTTAQGRKQSAEKHPVELEGMRASTAATYSQSRQASALARESTARTKTLDATRGADTRTAKAKATSAEAEAAFNSQAVNLRLNTLQRAERRAQFQELWSLTTGVTDQFTYANALAEMRRRGMEPEQMGLPPNFDPETTPQILEQMEGMATANVEHLNALAIEEQRGNAVVESTLLRNKANATWRFAQSIRDPNARAAYMEHLRMFLGGSGEAPSERIKVAVKASESWHISGVPMLKQLSMEYLKSKILADPDNIKHRDLIDKIGQLEDWTAESLKLAEIEPQIGARISSIVEKGVTAATMQIESLIWQAGGDLTKVSLVHDPNFLRQLVQDSMPGVVVLGRRDVWQKQGEEADVMHQLIGDEAGDDMAQDMGLN